MIARYTKVLWIPTQLMSVIHVSFVPITVRLYPVSHYVGVAAIRERTSLVTVQVIA